MSRPPMILLAASTRFLAESALRAGFQPICFDLFADTDLDDVAEVNRVESFALEHLAILFDTLAKYPQAPISYGGGIENFPDLIAQLEQTGRLAGANSASVNMARDLATIERLANQAGLSFPKYAKTIDALTIDRSWLMKPIHSAGGIGIRPFSPTREGTDGSPALPAGHYGQERITGVPASAIYWARNGQSVTRIGCTYQHVHGDPETFHYAGNRWALDLPPESLARLDAFAHLLGTQCNLVGVFGVDFMVNSDRNEFYILEVNPRVPASAELFEPGSSRQRPDQFKQCALSIEPAQGVGQSTIIDRHLSSFGFATPTRTALTNQQREQATLGQVEVPICVSKHVLYARGETIWNEQLRQALHQPITWRLDDPSADRAQIKLADLPHEGRLHLEAWPICTLLAYVDSRTALTQPVIDCIADTINQRARAVAESFRR